MKKVVFITRCKFPKGDASSKRYEVFLKYFYDRGYNPTFIGMGSSDYKKEVEIDGCKVVSLRRYKKPNAIQKVLNHLFIKNRIVSFASKYYNSADVAFIEPAMYKQFARHKKKFHFSTIICSVVEFYSPSEYKFNGAFSSSYKANVNFNNKVKPNDCKIIAISTYLEKHFLSKGMKVARIPFVLNNAKNEIIPANNGQIRKFIYCGNPRSKDNLKDILLAFCDLNDDLLRRTEVNIFGVKKDWLYKQNIKKELVDKILTFTGFNGSRPYDEVIKNYESSDFSLLLRPSKERYAMAGFPTKISESLEFGIPPITNFTSDLSLYLKDSENCVEVKGDSAEDFRNALEKSFFIENKDLLLMKENAKKTAVEKLDIKCFYSELDKIINE